MAKYKITPLARFFVFMLIAAPLLFLLATYMTGERKYLDQVIEWVQPKAEDLPADSMSADSSGSVDTAGHQPPSKSKEKSSPEPSVGGPKEKKEATISLRDSLNLLKKELKECRNK
jgi:hypothetical protein